MVTLYIRGTKFYPRKMVLTLVQEKRFLGLEISGNFWNFWPKVVLNLDGLKCRIKSRTKSRTNCTGQGFAPSSRTTTLTCRFPTNVPASQHPVCDCGQFCFGSGTIGRRPLWVVDAPPTSHSQESTAFSTGNLEISGNFHQMLFYSGLKRVLFMKTWNPTATQEVPGFNPTWSQFFCINPNPRNMVLSEEHGLNPS